jgi:hypothetical protein
LDVVQAISCEGLAPLSRLYGVDPWFYERQIPILVKNTMRTMKTIEALGRLRALQEPLRKLRMHFACS